MSRIANYPVAIPTGVEVNFAASVLTVKGKNGSLTLDVHPAVEITNKDNVLTFAPRDKDPKSNAMAGTFRALINNMVTGVTAGFEKKLELVGVGYRAQMHRHQGDGQAESRTGGGGYPCLSSAGALQG